MGKEGLFPPLSRAGLLMKGDPSMWRPRSYFFTMPPKLTKNDWKLVLMGLLSVPTNRRTHVWRRAYRAVESIVNGKNELSKTLEFEGIHYSVRCSLCKRLIRLDQEFILRLNPTRYNHLDCFHGEIDPEVKEQMDQMEKEQDSDTLEGDY
jgi:hypothetical protein